MNSFSHDFANQKFNTLRDRGQNEYVYARSLLSNLVVWMERYFFEQRREVR